MRGSNKDAHTNSVFRKSMESSSVRSRAAKPGNRLPPQFSHSYEMEEPLDEARMKFFYAASWPLYIISFSTNFALISIGPILQAKITSLSSGLIGSALREKRK